MKNALLLGNGLNRLNANYSWETLIRDLLRAVDPPNKPQLLDKPFPLFYEEIVQAALQVGMSEGDVKSTLSDLVENIGPSDLHDELPRIGASEILTTNYDYNVESCWPNVTPRNVGRSEAKYSLFRCKSFPGVNVWHIHGERERPESIMLGYEQYSGYLQNMRSYVLNGHAGRNLSSLVSRIKKNRRAPTGHSWLEFFFDRDLFILGLTMDYVEIHLWWLITYRARLMSMKGFPINNEISFIYPRFISSDIKSKLQLLQGANIKLKRIDNLKKNDWLGFYKKALRIVKNS